MVWQISFPEKQIRPGHLTDTYAVTNANSPAAQNFGNYEWTNADPSVKYQCRRSGAEDIYTGYKYYETRYADTVLGTGKVRTQL